jgi:HEAT repeat protein
MRRVAVVPRLWLSVMIGGGLAGACRGPEVSPPANPSATPSSTPVSASTAPSVATSAPTAVAVAIPVPVVPPGEAARARLAVAVAHDAPTPARLAAIRELGAGGDRGAVVPLAALLDAEAGPLEPAVRAALVQLEGTRTLTEQLGTADEAGRVRAVLLLVRVGDAAAGAALTLALTDVAPSVRERAASGLGALRVATADEALAARLRDDTSADVRLACAQALGQLATPRALAALEAARVAEVDAFVRSAIERALAAQATPSR